MLPTAVAPLSAEGFGRRYRRRRPWAVRDLDLEIPRGSITALVGPNGAGKSTLIRSWMGFERPDEGRVYVEGMDVRRNRARAVEKLAYIPQANALYRDLTIADHFAMAAAYRRNFDTQLATDRVIEAELAVDRSVGELSGGEQAQVALSIALGTGAPILLLDEPLANLDPLARREFLAMLVDHARPSGRTAVLSSHIVTDVQQACDWLVVLAYGRVLLNESAKVAKGTHRTVTSDDQANDVVGRFIGADGERLALVRSDDPGLPEASIEEVVLGYMASQRPRGGTR
jgi:ABC-2 type transport system ATP-binding protein